MTVVAERVSLAPQNTLPWRDELPLGARVYFTHRAAVMRWYERRPAEWVIVEGGERGGGWRPPINEKPDPDPNEPFLGFDRDPFYTRKPAHDEPNKSVVVWPHEGEGYLMGLTRRGIGRSWGPSGSTSMYEDNFEPGGFAAEAWVNLYAVKCTLQGVKPIYVPVWACSLSRTDAEYRLVRHFDGDVVGTDHIALGRCTPEKAEKRARQHTITLACRVDIEWRTTSEWRPA